jgi:glycolate oxidase iron-sulfur subunit
MQTKLSAEFKDSPAGRSAEAILRSCVHCGFCNATCPTYQVLGDELDGPRGRIYLIKQLLEGDGAGRSTQQHLDRCLTCLNCETTCPSGVEYGKLVSIGRELVDERVARPLGQRLLRWALREWLTSTWFAPAVRLAQAVRGYLPAALQRHVPQPAEPRADTWPEARHERKVLLLAGCVQPALLPNINGATARVLDAAGVETVVAPGAGCCGAIREHLSDREGSLMDARRNIDAWWPSIAQGRIESIVMNASACALAVKHYGAALRDDPQYRDKAARVSSMARDLSELLPGIAAALAGKVDGAAAGRMVFHPPCTLQHGQRLRGGVEAALGQLGFDVRAAGSEPHLCCGSAGTYSILQRTLSLELRDRKLAHLAASGAQLIVSANIGCIMHLRSGTSTAVRHWVEALDEALRASAGAQNLR